MVQLAMNVVISLFIFLVTLVGTLMGKISPTFEWLLGAGAIAVLAISIWGIVDDMLIAAASED